MNSINKLKMWVAVGLLSLGTSLSACPGQAVAASNTVKHQAKQQVLPITGSWINLAYKDVRNKYTNPTNFDNNDPKLWEAKVRELAEMGLEYLVFMEVANDGKAYYPSKLMPWHYTKGVKGLT